ncbi:ArsR family transcriptional regulator [Halopenitus persicus]|uniref:ArsR family transcriptional regulator n=1 Tax=Halopenitus persicus TaxID=1048396 RepID=UPI000BBABDDF|nr:ArsR family transcriptional regulator [Halopenitus persicus]
MDSAVLLDLLGNENRRRILRLLSRKSCYVTEISEYLGVSPKAVIDHLRKLEEAGLIESTTDEKRRKYFRISRSLRLEVNVSPYGFGVKSAYPANPGLDMSGRCPHLSIEIDRPDAVDLDGTENANGHTDGTEAGRRDDPADPGNREDPTDPGNREDPADLADLAMEYDRLRELDRELSLAQRWVHGRIEAVLSRIDDRFGLEADSRFYAEVIAAVVETDGTPETVAAAVGSSPDVVEDALARLRGAGLLAREGDRFIVR